MINKLIKKKSVIILDLDGVLLNSKNNMRYAWKQTSKINNLRFSFNDYFKHVGLPFTKILSVMGIKNKKIKIKKDYDRNSIKNINRLKIYPNVITTISKLKKQNKSIALFTSKDSTRTKLFTKKFKIQFDHMECGGKSIKGKPYPDQIRKILKKFNCPRNKAVYIGDMYHDYLSAKNAGIDFIFAEYGYGGLRSLEIKWFIKNFNDLIK